MAVSGVSLAEAEFLFGAGEDGGGGAGAGFADHAAGFGEEFGVEGGEALEEGDGVGLHGGGFIGHGDGAAGELEEAVVHGIGPGRSLEGLVNIPPHGGMSGRVHGEVERVLHPGGDEVRVVLEAAGHGPRGALPEPRGAAFDEGEELGKAAGIAADPGGDGIGAGAGVLFENGGGEVHGGMGREWSGGREMRNPAVARDGGLCLDARLMSALSSFTLSRPLDMHLHLRDGEMLSLVAPLSAEQFAGAVIMPNLVPPVTSVEMLTAYRTRILAACGVHAEGFQPLMTLFFQHYTEAQLAAAQEHLFAIKLYPHGVTTNSESGIHSIDAAEPTMRLMEEMGIPLLVHGETTGFVMDREREFLSIYERLAVKFPRLRIVMEHITTAAAVALLDRFENLHATVTPHHLIITLDDVAGGMLQPHLFCKPIAKRPEDRDALLAAALAAHPKLMMGSDSAPHPQHAKECCGCAAGVWSAPVLLPRLVELFEAYGALDRLQAFVSDNAVRIHGLNPPAKTVTLLREPWRVPAAYSGGGLPTVVPWEAGRELPWRLA